MASVLVNVTPEAGNLNFPEPLGGRASTVVLVRGACKPLSLLHAFGLPPSSHRRPGSRHTSGSYGVSRGRKRSGSSSCSQVRHTKEFSDLRPSPHFTEAISGQRRAHFWLSDAMRQECSAWRSAEPPHSRNRILPCSGWWIFTLTVEAPLH